MNFILPKTYYFSGCVGPFSIIREIIWHASLWITYLSKTDSNKTYFFQKQFKNGQHELFNNLFTAFFARFLPLCIALMSFHSFPYFKHVNQTFFFVIFSTTNYTCFSSRALNFFLKRIRNEESIMSNNQ